MKGILGRKIGMTQVFTTDGKLIPVTVVEATSNVVLQKKTVATDGYDAIQVGFEDKREKLATKAHKGHGSGAHRIVGSMGPIAPNRIAPGKKLPGQMGHVTRTVQNLEVVAVDVENNLLLIKGSVPGPKKGLVIVKSGIKAAGKVNEAHELVDFTPVVEETKEADAATETPVEAAE